MKQIQFFKSIFILLFVLATSSLSAQLLTSSISGYVTNGTTGLAVANAAVTISAIDSTVSPPFQFNVVVYTNMNGYYTSNVTTPTSSPTFITYTVSTTGCGTIISGSATVSPNGGPHIVNLTICGSSATCNALFAATTSGNSVYITNQSTGASPGSQLAYNWTVSNGFTSMAITPLFPPFANGSHTICLTITDSLTGCTDTYCDSIYVNSTTNCDAAFTANATMLNPCDIQFDLFQGLGYSNILWIFGDGSTLSGLNNAPLHTYNASGNYTVMCAVSDSTGTCDIDTMLITVNCTAPTSNIYGYVSKSAPGTNVPANASVFLIDYDATAGTLTALDTVVTDSMGYYNFGSVATGSYYVKAALNTADVDYTGYVPTYFGQVLFWNQATVASVNTNNNISMTGGNNPGGPGFIGGLVSQGANKTSGVGDPLANLTILLTDMSDNPIGYAYTDVNGQYGFSNLAYGTYKVWTDVLNKTCIPNIVTISPASSSVTNANIDVNSTYTTAIVAGIASNFGIYPNPVQNELTITMKADAGKVAECKVIDMMGRVVLAKSLNQTENTISVSEMPAACYILLISTEKGSFTQKIVKE